MTELILALQDTAQPEKLYLGMPLPLVMGILGGLATIGAAAFAAFSKRWRTPADTLAEKKVALEADERLLKRFEDMLKERDDKLEALEGKVDKLNQKVEEYQRERTGLIDFIYELVRIVRDLGGLARIPVPPGGIYIAGHPANATQEQEA
jgi:hypothetical protein